MATSLELYELLKEKLGAEAARVLSESMPERDELATKADLLATKADLKAEIDELKADIRGWMLTFFVRYGSGSTARSSRSSCP